MTTPPIIFLLGPSGASKTTLGSRAYKELGLEFLNRILEAFAAMPYSFEFEREFTDRPTLVARYRRNLDGRGQASAVIERRHHRGGFAGD